MELRNVSTATLKARLVKLSRFSVERMMIERELESRKA